MRLSDAGLRRHQTKLIYPDHRHPPWLTENATPRSLEPIVRRTIEVSPTDTAEAKVAYEMALRRKRNEKQMIDGSRAELADAIHGCLSGGTAKKPAKLPSYRISPAKRSGFIAMNNEIMRPRAKPTIVPAATPRQSTFCSPFVISHLQGLLPPYHYRTAIYQQLQASSQ